MIRVDHEKSGRIVSTTIVVIVVVVLLLIAAAVFVVPRRRRRTQALRDQFGAEYDRTLARTGDRRAAEQELQARQAHHDTLDIRTLAPAEREHYRQSWQQIQRGFVDDPGAAIHDADHLVVVIMSERGYPVEDFEQRADDVSVTHPLVVEHYRAARRVRDAHQAGRASTEDLRGAVGSYRDLVEALLDDGGTQRPGDPPTSTGHRNPGDNHRDRPGDDHRDRAGDNHRDQRGDDVSQLGGRT